MNKWSNLAVSMVMFWVCNAFAQTPSVPPLINYQGRLTDAGGNGTNGTANLTFNIYSNAVGGTAVWGPQAFSNVPLVDGHFNVILGTTDAGGRSILDAWGSKDRYLGISVNGAAEIVPRQQVLSAPYAVQARNAELLNGQVPAFYAPPGCIMAYWGTNAPFGWLLCDGTAIPLSKEYDALRSLVGSNTPNLRGRVVVGRDTGQAEFDGLGETGGAKTHTLSTAEMPSHNHAMARGANANGPKVCVGNSENYGSNSTGSEGGGGAHNNLQPYIVLNYIIKY